METEEIRKIARRLDKVKLMFEVQDREAVVRAHNALYRAAVDIEDLEREKDELQREIAADKTEAEGYF